MAQRRKRAVRKTSSKKGSFKSGFEKTTNKLLKRTGKGLHFIYEDKNQKLSYEIPHTYLPDFILTNKDETSKIYIETKGYFSAEDRRKMKHVLRCNPDADVRFVFMRNNYLTKSKKQRYSDWCDRHNVLYAFEEIPKEWLDELRD